MTTRVFFENATPYNYTVFDQDGHKFTVINSNGYYGVKLNYSPTFEKRYTFIDNNDQTNNFYMWLGVDGEITKIYPNQYVHLEVKPEEYHTRVQLFPPPVKTYDRVTPCCHLYGNARNKLLITPIDNIYARITPLVARPVPDRSLRLDFTG